MDFGVFWKARQSCSAVYVLTATSIANMGCMSELKMKSVALYVIRRLTLMTFRTLKGLEPYQT